VTFGVFRQPSFMGRLGIPFIVGPLGGGERTPFRLRMGYGFRAHVLDAVRDVANVLATWRPSVRHMFATANLILVKTPHTGRLVSSRFRHKVRHLLEIGAGAVTRTGPAPRKQGPFRFLFVGRFLFWKGMQYGLRAFARVLRELPDVRLTMIGAGPDEARWRELSRTLNITQAVDWVSWVPQRELEQLYCAHQTLLFPSLHDSSGGVVLDALSHGLPVVCLDLGGPGVLVNESCGIVVTTAGRTRRELIADLAQGMKVLANQPDKLHELQAGALARARELTWSAAVRSVYDIGGLWETRERHGSTLRGEVSR